MSFHFSRALVADYSQAAYSDGGLSAPSKYPNIAVVYSDNDKATEQFHVSLSGTTLEPSTDSLGGDVLTSYLAAFPARRIPRRLEVSTLRMISGRKCGESWQRQLPGTYLPRTPKDARSTARQMSLRRWVIKPAVLPFPRRTWVATTFGTDIGFVHTPTATANYASPSMKKWPNCRAFVKVFGQPSPEAHEWLMDWPEGWSDLKPLATDKFQSWLQRHGAF